MTAARRLLAHRRLAALLCVAALLLRLLVPAGFMLGGGHGRVTIELCAGVAAPPMAMAGMAGHGKAPEHGKAEMPCAFSGLSAAVLGVSDAVWVAAPVAFVAAVVPRTAVPPPPLGREWLRPPLRGPPARR